ncbi:SUMF1/EgtB/PvdO family nonheme iron enzyme [Candidatus Dependentiae bacterium]|nr:SUMF1/EgtB/PvdO family nonheme iron enzyme [Candidatus Dependentiae bacterium]
MKLFIVILFSMLINVFAFSNQLPYIINIKKEIHGSKLNISFDLHDKESKTLKVYLLDKRTGKQFSHSHPGVEGDIGPKIAIGPKKKVSCDLSKINLVDFDPIIFASDGIAIGTEMILLRETKSEKVYISKYEALNVQFLMFVQSDGYSNQEYWKVTDTKIVDEDLAWDYCTRYRWIAPRFWNLSKNPYWKSDKYSNLPTTPVVGISWFGANAFTIWSESKLITREDWLTITLNIKKAPDIPWKINLFNNEQPPVYKKANLKFSHRNYKAKSFNSDGFEFCAPAGVFKPIIYNKQEIHDLLGNVYEWVQDFGRPVIYTSHTCVERYMIGGSWKTGVKSMSYPMTRLCPIYRMETIGFRYKIVVEK